MPMLTTYHLFPKGAWHLGTGGGVHLEKTGFHVSSDTLFAAVLDALARAGTEPGEIVARFPRLTDEGESPGDAPFLLTSAFPKVGDVRFYPAPIPLHRWLSANFLRENRKKVKKLRFVSEGVFEKMLTGENLDGSFYEVGEGVALQEGIFWLMREEISRLPGWIDRKNPAKARIFSPFTAPRVTVGRIHPQSTLFHAGRLVMAPECGLWFGVEVRDSGGLWMHLLETGLAILADDGIGGERSAGHGGFRWRRGDEISIGKLPQAGGHYITLSRYHPKRSELPNALSEGETGYELTSIAGWLRSWSEADQRRRRLWMTAEGSVLKAVGGGPFGNVVDVRPVYPGGAFPHPVWRYGMAMPVALGGAA